MNEERKTVAIIGAGPSGLTSIKACLEEGMKPFCFERENSLGGLWKYSENEMHSSVYKSTVINTSRGMSGFSDFPISKRFPVFMPHTQILEYLNLYASRFDLYKYISFDVTITQVRKASSYTTTGKWVVSYRKKNSEVKTMVFDSVLVCSGHLWCPSLPSFQGMDSFKGVQMHSHSYKYPDGFKNKKVLVVGLGNSAADIATELSHSASQVYLSTRRGAWVISRISSQGLPWDYYYERRVYTKLPSKMFEWILLRFAQGRFDHDNYGVRPRHGILNAPSVISDELPHRIANGSLQMKPNVSHLSRTGVVFEDGSVIDELDIVIYCTGYKVKFGFLNDDIVKVQDNHVALYKYVFPPDLIHPTLGFIGLTQSSGAVFPLVELQARWACRIISGKCHLPCRELMLHDIKRKKEEMEDTFIHTKRCTIQVSSIVYKDEIADLIGCKPSLLRLMFSDPFLALLCFFGPCTSFQYRLLGPGCWTGAREAIRSAYCDVYPKKPTTERRNKEFVIRQCIIEVLSCAIFDVTSSLFTPVMNYISNLIFP